MIRGSGRTVVLSAIQACAESCGESPVAWCDGKGESYPIVLHAPPHLIADAEQLGYFRVVSRKLPVVELHTHDGKATCPYGLSWHGVLVRVTPTARTAARDEFITDN